MAKASLAITLIVALMVAALVAEPNLTSFYTLIMLPIFAVVFSRDPHAVTQSVAQHRIGILTTLGLLIVASLSVFWATPEPAAVLPRSAKLTGEAALLLIVLLLPLSRPVSQSVMRGLIIGAVLVALFLIENTFFGTLKALLTEPTDIHNWYNLHKLPATTLVLLMFPIAMVVWRVEGLGAGPLFWRLAASIALCGVLLSDHLTAILVLFIGALTCCAAMFWPRIVAATCWTAAALMLFVVPVVVTKSDINPLLAATAGEKSLQHRVLILDFATQQIAERPWLGWGLDGSRFLPGGSDRVADTPGRLGGRIDPDVLHQTVLAVAQNLPLHPHNLLIQVRLELGVPGSVMALAALAVALLALVKIQHRMARAVSLGALISAASISSFGFGAWQSWWLAEMILILAACRVAIRLLEREPDAI